MIPPAICRISIISDLHPFIPFQHGQVIIFCVPWPDEARPQRSEELLAELVFQLPIEANIGVLG